MQSLSIGFTDLGFAVRNATVLISCLQFLQRVLQVLQGLHMRLWTKQLLYSFDFSASRLLQNGLNMSIGKPSRLLLFTIKCSPGCFLLRFLLFTIEFFCLRWNLVRNSEFLHFFFAWYLRLLVVVLLSGCGLSLWEDLDNLQSSFLPLGDFHLSLQIVLWNRVLPLLERSFNRSFERLFGPLLQLEILHRQNLAGQTKFRLMDEFELGR